KQKKIVEEYITHFFFSSRRRHTRWPRDWSSDVCSSDLAHLEKPVTKEALDEAFAKIRGFVERRNKSLLVIEDDEVQRNAIVELKIGRASCRERVERWVVGGTWKREEGRRGGGGRRMVGA